MPCSWHVRFSAPAALGAALCLLIAPVQTKAVQAAAPALVTLPGHLPAMVAGLPSLGQTNPNTVVTLAFVLPIRNKAALDSLVQQISDPQNALYGQYLTPAQFQSQFSPTQADYTAVAQFATASGFTVTHTSPSRTLLNVTGPASLVNAAFHLTLLDYQRPDGSIFHAPSTEPSVPAAVASKITGVIGLSNAAVWVSNRRTLPKSKTHVAASPHLAVSRLGASPLTAGSGMFGGLTPKDIETAYGLKSYPPAVATDTVGYGAGQTLGVFELDTYLPTDILLYEQKFGLPTLLPTNELDPTDPVTPTGGEDEVTLDIELQLAVAPLAKALYVYAGGNLSSLTVQQYQKIADDDLAKSVSTSWGAPEIGNDPVTLDGESDAFEQMAAQGQSIFAASGDNGAYDGAGTSATVNMTDATALLVDDPASQPYMCGVGGTTLTVATAPTNESYVSEQSWGTPATGSGGGGGGGISQIWSVPFYQKGLVPSAKAIPSSYYPVTTAHPDPKTHRNVPDVSFNANPDTGYDIVFGGTDALLVGGTSCAAPLWAGFAALVNEQRAANALPSLGFANPPIYKIGTSNFYKRDFHDIADGSTNLYFPAVAGYDSSTGWGSFQGANLVTDLGSPVPINVQVQPGDKDSRLQWSASPDATAYHVYRASAGGSPVLIATLRGTTLMDYQLTNGTKYSYYVQAVYTGGQSFPYGPVTTIPGVVQISYGPYVKTAPGTATVSWTTSVLSQSVVLLGTSPSTLTQAAAISGLSQLHSLTVSGLTHGKVYYYQVKSYDGYVTATSSVYTFSEP